MLLSQGVDCGGSVCRECHTQTPAGQVFKLPWPESDVSQIGSSLTASAPTASRGISVATPAYLYTDSEYYFDSGAVVYEGDRENPVRAGRLGDNGPGFVSMDDSGNYLMIGTAYPDGTGSTTGTNHVVVMKRRALDLTSPTPWYQAARINIPGGWSNVDPYKFAGVLSSDARTAVLMHQDAIYITAVMDMTVEFPTWGRVGTIFKPPGDESHFRPPLVFARGSGQVLLATAVTVQGERK